MSTPSPTDITAFCERLSIPTSSPIVDQCVTVCMNQHITLNVLESKIRYIRSLEGNVSVSGLMGTGTPSELTNQCSVDQKLIEKVERDIEEKKVTASAAKQKQMLSNIVNLGGHGYGQILDKNSILKMGGSTSRLKSEFDFAEQTPEKSGKKKSIPASAASFLSPAPQGTYGTRVNRNKLELSVGDFESNYVLSENLELTRDVKNAEIVHVSCLEQELYQGGNSNAFSNSFRYLYQNLNTGASEMSAAIRKVALDVAAENGFDSNEFKSCDMPVDSEVYVYGRIVSDSLDGKLNPASLLLEGDDSVSQGRRVKLDVSALDSYALFPGQAVVVLGNNPTGRLFVAKKLFAGSKLPFATTNEATAQQYNMTVSVMIAAGPFHLCSPVPINIDGRPSILPETEIKFEPLADVLNVAKLQKPDVLILVGPFLDAESEIIRNVCAVFDKTFAEMLSFIVDEAEKNTTIVLVPSSKDVNHHLTFPQPPFDHPSVKEALIARAKLFSSRVSSSVPELQEQAKMYFCPNPCTLRINDMVLGVVSEDIFFDISKNVVVQNCPDRISASYLLNQQSYVAY